MIHLYAVYLEVIERGMLSPKAVQSITETIVVFFATVSPLLLSFQTHNPDSRCCFFVPPIVWHDCVCVCVKGDQIG